MSTARPSTRLIGIQLKDDNGILLPRSDSHEYVPTDVLAEPPSAQRLGNKTLGDLDTESLKMLYQLMLYSRGLQPTGGRALEFKNGTGKKRKEQAIAQVARLLVSNDVKPGHFRGAREANRFVHNRLDLFFDGSGRGAIDLSDVEHEFNSCYKERPESDSEINSRRSRDSDGHFRYRTWTTSPGELSCSRAVFTCSEL